jgi:dGTPase
MPTGKSLGRRYSEPPHPYRGEYERDRDRIIHSRAFRRLENKTQVFSYRYSDHFRNRLTHTLEVAQISRTVARSLNLNWDLAEALALVHDVGHPPFGHAGEAALNRLMMAYDDSFDHNLHALRVVERFEQKYVGFPGLNLTFEVREGIIKHSRDYSPAEFPELAEYLLDQRPPIEAQIIDLADEIAYNCADLDDGYEAKLLGLAQMLSGLPLFRRLFEPFERHFPQAPEKLKFNEALKRLMDALVTDLIAHTRRTIQERGIDSLRKVRACETRLVGLSPRMAAHNRQIKAFLHQNLYTHADVSTERKKIVGYIEKLFAHFVRHPRSLPRFYFAQTRDDTVYRVACDYIAGMTDNYLRDQYRKFCRRRG